MQDAGFAISAIAGHGFHDHSLALPWSLGWGMGCRLPSSRASAIADFMICFLQQRAPAHPNLTCLTKDK
jgi:hypothetical protein